MKNNTLKTTKTKNQGVKAVMEGDLIVRDSQEIKQELQNLIENHQSVEIYFENINRIDVTAIQLLLALSKSAAKQEKTVNYHFQKTEYICNILSICGMNNSSTTY